jgi:type I restriction enzyme S subunit
MKSGWKTVKIGDIALVGAGNSAPQDDADFSTDGPHFVRTSDVGEVKFGTVNSSNDRLSSKGAKGMRLWKAGTILIPKSGASTFVNHRVILGVDAHVSSHLATIQAEPTRCDNRYLLYYLSTVKAQDLIQDQSYPSLKLPEIAGIEIPLPSLAEQKRVVALLEEAFACIDEAKAKIDECAESVANILQVFVDQKFGLFSRTCPHRPLKEVSEYFNGLTYAPPDVSDTGTVVLRSSNVQEGKLDLSERVRVSARIKEKLYVRAGDVLMCSRNGSKRLIGKCTLIPAELPERMTFGTFMMIIRSEIGPFLDLFFNSSRFKTQMASGSATNINQITRGMLDSVELPIADSAESAAFVGKAAELSALLDEYGARLSRRTRLLQEMKSSLLTQAFAGELTA